MMIDFFPLQHPQKRNYTNAKDTFFFSASNAKGNQVILTVKMSNSTKRRDKSHKINIAVSEHSPTTTVDWCYSEDNWGEGKDRT